MIKNNIGISCTQYSQKDHIRKISKKGKKKKQKLFYLLTLEIRKGTWQSNSLFAQSRTVLDFRSEEKQRKPMKKLQTPTKNSKHEVQDIHLFNSRTQDEEIEMLETHKEVDRNFLTQFQLFLFFA